MHFTIDDYPEVVYQKTYYEVRIINTDIQVDSREVDIFLPDFNYIVSNIQHGTIEGVYMQLTQACSVCEQLDYIMTYEKYKVSVPEKDPTPPNDGGKVNRVLKFPH